MNKKDQIAARILSYLRKNPDAGDTLEGITNWWLHLEKIDESIKDVSEVVEELTKRGFLTKEEVQGGRTLYKIDKKNENRD